MPKGWQPGTSGNPSGRPPKNRALTTVLEKTGGKRIEYRGKQVSGRILLARLVWQGLITGTIEFPDGSKLRLSPQDWKDFVKFVYGQIDGAPRGEMDVTSGGEKIIVTLKAPNDAD